MREHWTLLYHRLIETVCRVRSQLDLSRLDAQPAVRSQTRNLLGLVHRARKTPFGRDHDFCRIRTPADFRRLVPLQSPHEPSADPESAVQLRKCLWGLGHANGTAPARLSLAAPQREAFRFAVRTGLALAATRKLPLRLYSGRLLLAPPSLPAWPDRPLLLHPWSLGEAVSSLKLLRLAGSGVAWSELLRNEPITCLAGSVEGMLRIGEMVAPGGDLSSVWPDLALVLSLQEDASPPPAELCKVLGPRARLFQAIACLDAVIALSDPRHGRLRLLTDHGLFFEFIPEDQRSQPEPERRDLSQVPCGVPHELVLTSPLGLWACRTDLVLTLARIDPPLLASLERRPLAAPVPGAQTETQFPSLQLGLSGPQPLPAPHQRRSADSPAATPEMFGQGSWSVPADRG